MDMIDIRCAVLNVHFTVTLQQNIINSPPGGVRSIVMSMSVCLSVRSHNSKTTRPNFTKFFVRIACGPGPDLFWRRWDTLCTSGFADDVMFSHNGPTMRNVYS